MKNKVLFFVLGAGVGALVTWKFVEEKYKRIADEEIESVIEYYKRKEETESNIEKVETFDTKQNGTVSFSETDKEEYENNVQELGYVQEEQEEKDIVDNYTFDTGEEPPLDFFEPYVISPEEYDEYGNELKSWTYYADHVLVDENGEIVSDPEQYIGNALEHFGDYEDDCVHVRNENLYWDIEVLKSEESFTEINREDN